MGKSDITWERDLDIWQAWCRREPTRQIAARHNISHQRVSIIALDMAGRIPAEVKADAIARTVSLYDEWIFETTKLVNAEPIPAYSNGRPIVDESGRTVMDHTGRLAAMGMGLKVSESWRKLLGLDQPAKVEVEQQVRYILENVDDADLT